MKGKKLSIWKLKENSKPERNGRKRSNLGNRKWKGAYLMTKIAS